MYQAECLKIETTGVVLCGLWRILKKTHLSEDGFFQVWPTSCIHHACAANMAGNKEVLTAPGHVLAPFLSQSMTKGLGVLITTLNNSLRRLRLAPGSGVIYCFPVLCCAVPCLGLLCCSVLCCCCYCFCYYKKKYYYV